MTNSEKLTNLISQKYFLKQYIYSDLYVKENGEEKEFCDCLLEYDNIYVCIQIKERNETADGSAYKWFRKKVLKVAKNQIKDTFSFFENSENIIFSKTSDFVVDRNKTMIPVIVFLNSELSKYDRIVYSRSLDTHINIFSYADFEIMLKTVVMPRDILHYLIYRSVFKPQDDGKIIFDEVNDDLTIITRLHKESDYAELFLARTYYSEIRKNSVDESAIKFYNTIVESINEQNDYKRCQFIEGFLRTNYVGAARIAEKWTELVTAAKEERFVVPFWISTEERLYMFAVHPHTMSDEEYNYRINLCAVYRKHKEGYKFLHLLTFQNEASDQYSVSLADANLEEGFPYESLIEDALKLFEED